VSRERIGRKTPAPRKPRL